MVPHLFLRSDELGKDGQPWHLHSISCRYACRFWRGRQVLASTSCKHEAELRTRHIRGRSGLTDVASTHLIREAIAHEETVLWEALHVTMTEDDRD